MWGLHAFHAHALHTAAALVVLPAAAHVELVVSESRL